MRKRISAVIFAFSCLMLFSGAAAAQSRASVPAAEVNGTFRMNFTGKYKGSSNEIKILALGGGKVRVAMELVYPYKMQNGELMANMGELDGEASISGDTAVYSATEFGKCTITIKFVTPGTIKVAQDGTDADCGFGHNVMATGTYKKVSSKKPTFETH
ncbi:MAG: hypothetical protein ABL999_04030 [Pyrinomonadaceae bacterium]